MIMKNFISSILIFTAIVFAGIIIPKAAIKSADNITEEDQKCADIAVSVMYDNPFQRLFIMQVAAKEKQGQILQADVYTFYGIKFSSKKIDCNEWQ